MSAAHCGSGELDFRLIFEEATAQPLGSTDLEPDDRASFYIFNVDQPLSAVSQPICTPWHGDQPHSSAFTPTSCFQGFKTFDGTNEVQERKCNPSGVPKPFECPSIQITSISPNCHQDTETTQELQKGDLENDYVEGPSRDHLQLEPSYREPSLSPSPGSSISSKSWFSDASSCESVSHIYDDVESELNEAAAHFSLGSPLTSPSGSPRGFTNDDAWQPFCYGASLSPRQSPCHSLRTSITDENWLSPRPTSRPSSPYGKRRHSSAEICYLSSPHHSPTPSPSHSPRGSVTEDTWITLSHTAANSASPPECFQETNIPLKTRKTSEDQSTTLLGKIDLGVEDQGNLSPTLETLSEDSTGSPLPLRKDSFTDQFLSVPSHFTWNKPKSGHTPVFRFDELLELLSSRLQKKDSYFRNSIPPVERLIITLRYLATGQSIASLHYVFRIGKSTASYIIRDTCSAIWDVLKPIVFKKPTEQEWAQISELFLQRCNFPNCLGAIDGKHIRIVKPMASGSQYFNYKKYFSFVSTQSDCTQHAECHQCC